MEKIDLDAIKKLGNQPLSNDANSRYVFLISIEHVKLTKNLNDADFKKYLGMWKAFA